MQEDIHEIFDKSFWRVIDSEVNHKRFLDTFYDLFIASSPDVKEKFANTNLERQKNMLRYSFQYMVDMKHEDKSSGYLEHIAAIHNRSNHDIPSYMYDLWLDALVESVKIHDPEYTETTGNAWREALSKGIQFMIERYDKTNNNK